jgi:hypothetical protein
MIKTLADEFMDIMNNLDNGCPASRTESLYNDIKDMEKENSRLSIARIWFHTTMSRLIPFTNSLRVNMNYKDFKELEDILFSEVAKVMSNG